MIRKNTCSGFPGLISLLASLPLLAAAPDYTPAELQMTRSVLERQATLGHLDALAAERANTEAVRKLAAQDAAQENALRARLLEVSKLAGMTGVDGLGAPGYFSQAEPRLLKLTGVEFDRQYLLLALQCHAFIERSLNATLRTGGNAALQDWIRQHIGEFELQSREIDHALYDLKP